MQTIHFYCPSCGGSIRETTESDANFIAGAFACLECSWSGDTPPKNEPRFDDQLTELCFKYQSSNGLIKIWCMPGNAYYEYQIFRDGKEVARSDFGAGSVDAALMRALQFVLEN